MGNLISEETLHKLEADASFQQLSQMMQTLNIFEVLGTTPCSTPRGSNMPGASELPLRQDFAA